VTKKSIITSTSIVFVIIVIGIVLYILYGGKTTNPTNTNSNVSTGTSSEAMGSYIASTSSLNNFNKLISAAGVNNMLNNTTTNYLVLAPENSAFNNLPNGYFDSLLNTNSQAAQNIAKYSIVSNPSGQLTSGLKLSTDEGQQIVVGVAGNQYTFTDAKGDTATTVSAPQKTANGTIYFVNNVLLPQ